MGYRIHDDLSSGQGAGENSHIIQVDGQDSIALPDASYVRDADMTRDGMDLVLDGPQGQLVIEGYFAGDQPPMLSADDGSSLSPDLVNSFVKSAPEYAQNFSMTDESPVGAVNEVSGDATVTRTDGSTETIQMGTSIYQGDVIETSADGAVNITFSDDSSFAVSEDARLAIDEYVYDPSTESGSQDFSVLKGVFVFTSGLIGRDDPDDVGIDTPVGSIGIRGTIIAGDVNSGEITVVEGAIVLRDFDGNEMTLASQFETGTFKPGQGIEYNGQKAANDVADKFQSVSKVSPNLFSSINDAAAEAIDANGVNEDVQVEEMLDEAPAADEQAAPDADGSVDDNSDGQVDGSVQGGEVVGDQTSHNVGDGTVQQVVQTITHDGLSGDSSGLATPKLTAPQPIVQKTVAPTVTDTTIKATTTTTTVEKVVPPNTNDGTVDPKVYTPTTGTTTPQIIIDSLSTDADGYHQADRGGVIYEGTTGIDKFTNRGSGGFIHQDYSVRTYQGADEVVIHNGSTGNRDFININLGEGEDIITFKLEGSTNNLKGGWLFGGNGADTLKIESTGTAIVDLRNIDYIKSIGTIDSTDSKFQTVSLHIDQIFEMAESNGSNLVLKINRDDDDYFKIYTDGTNATSITQDAGGYDVYQYTRNGVQLDVLLQDQGSGLGIQEIP